MRPLVIGVVVLFAWSGCRSAADIPQTDPVFAGSGGSKPPPKPKLTYVSDCSLTHPIARDPCQGTPAVTRGLKSCAALKVKPGEACKSSSPSCYIERGCGDGRQVIADYLVCVDKAPGRCLTRSARQFKTDIEYLSAVERTQVARQVETLPLARFRYTDQSEGQRLGFLIEDAPGAPFVTEDGRTVDLYALLAASIASLQDQDARIRALEARVAECGR